jgi:hypothetical protein
MKGTKKWEALERVQSKAEKRHAADQAVLDQLAREADQVRQKTERLRALRAARASASSQGADRVN